MTDETEEFSANIVVLRLVTSNTDSSIYWQQFRFYPAMLGFEFLSVIAVGLLQVYAVSKYCL